MIYAMARDLKIDNESLHELTAAWCGITSLKSNSCTKAQAQVIIDCLKKLQDTPAGTPAQTAAPGGATPEQLNAIRKIAQSKGWNTERLNGFIKHTTGCASLDGISSANASRVITGLKKFTVTKTT